MNESSLSASVFRFGPYQFHADRGELRKSGRLLKLQPQPARLLELLVRNAGTVVRREQIQRAVWGSDTQVDYELGVNRCIRQIRSALLDDADAPRYIKTISRQGYVFVAQVERGPITPVSGAGTAAPLSPLSAIAEEAPLPVGVVEEPLRVANVKPRGQSAWTVGLQRALMWLACGLAIGGTVEYLTTPGPAPAVKSHAQLTNDFYPKVIKTGPFARSICTDGARLYFSVQSGAATSEIAQVPITGGETSLLPPGLPSPILLDFSKARSQFLIASGSGISDLQGWIQPLPAGSPQRLTELRTSGASWSADGNRLVFGSGHELFLAAGDGSNPQLLGKFDAGRKQHAYWPRWSPDGREIRFSLFDGVSNSSALWSISTEGTGLHQLFPDWSKVHESCCGSWTGDGHYYVFASSHDQRRSDLWIAATRTGILDRFRKAGAPVQMTAGPLSYSAPLPGVSDGTIFAIGETRRSELMSFEAGSGDFKALAPGISALQADFSRDGKRLAFVDFTDHTLWVSKKDGTERRQLTFAPLQVSVPRWSPDGKQLAFHGNLPNHPGAIYTFTELDGSLRQVAGGKESDAMDPDWSADSQQIIFSDASRNGQRPELKIVNVADGAIASVPDSAGLRSPRWSPNGRFISAITSDLHRLMLYDTVAKAWKSMNSFRMGYVNWSRDSKYVYLVNLASRPGIWRIRISDGKTEQVVDMSRRNQYWTDDAWLGLTPADVPFVSRDISIQQLFALRCVLP